MFTILLLILSVYTDKCHILALSGGGAHGSFQAGVIKQIHEKGVTWDVITGISAGSLNAIGLALFPKEKQQTAIDNLQQIWYNITRNSVYKHNLYPPWDQSLYDNTPLNTTIYNFVLQTPGTIQRNIVIGSVCFNTGKLELFYASDMSDISDIVHVVMASTSSPLLFPPHLYRGKYYVDGGLFSNQIIAPGINYCFDNNKTDIKITVISCDQPVKEITTEEINNYHLLGAFLRDYDIGVDALLNHELYTDCSKSKYQFPMYIYLPQDTLPGGWFDFEHNDLVTSFKIGYVTQPNITRYCM